MEISTVDSDARRLEISHVLDTATAAVVRVVCGIGLVNALFQLGVTGLTRPTALGVTAAATWALLWWLALDRAPAIASQLDRWPWLVACVGAVGMAPVTFDGGLDGTLATQALWLTWIAAVTVSARMTIATAVAIAFASAAALGGAGMSIHDMFIGPDRFQATLLIGSPLITALVGLALVGVFRTVLHDVPSTVMDIRAGAPASTPGLTALLHGQAPRMLEPPPSASEQLTDAELEVISLLRAGHTPQQIALQRGRSVATVRTQIKHAKRKLGARTINELISRTWPMS